MKVAVITRHAMINYGSLLQAIATQQVVEGLGHTCEIIDYIRADEALIWYELSSLKRKPKWNGNFITRAIYFALRVPESVLAGWKFQTMRREHLKLSQRYSTLQSLEERTPSADVFMTGSDQVWGPVIDHTYDLAYCLSFTKNSDKRIAYAASFGLSTIPDAIIPVFQNWLGRYRHITVREDQAKRMLDGMGLISQQVLDPTLLLTAEAWSRYISAIPMRKYVLVYQIHNDRRLGAYARAVAKAKRMPLIRVTPMLHQLTRPGRTILLPRLGEFLSYIKNAECLITDSYHGTAFAIIFNTPFVEVITDTNTESRNLSILRLAGLAHRVLDDDNNIELADEPIDFGDVNRRIGDNRQACLDILQTILVS